MTSKRAFFKNQDYEKIRRSCLEEGELFYDDLFAMDVEGAVWLRPKNLVKEPRFFVDGASRFDVVQGGNSDCWLLVAIANLTMNPTLFDHVVPKNQTFTDNYAGIFRFNIWQCGKWVEVVVDDRLPTKSAGGEYKLKFVHSKTKNEFWSALLEKAYAKLYGSYNELTAGWYNEAIVDLTGGIVERIELQPPPDGLVAMIKKSLEKSSFMCVFMMNDPSVKEAVLENGLVKGHAYSVTNFLTVTSGGRKVQLIRLRNPWGKLEWKGAWSDSSPEWNTIPAEEKNRIGLVAENDGEFYLPIIEFTANFQYIDVCHLTPSIFEEVITGGKHNVGWESHMFKGEWTKGVTAGGFCGESFHLNLQYRVVLADSDDDSESLCTVIIGLLQRNKSRNVWHKIGFTAFRLEGSEKDSNKPLSQEYLTEHFRSSSSSKFSRLREIVVRDAWEPGVYVLVPSTYEEGKEGQFLLRVYSERKVHMHEADTRRLSAAPILDVKPAVHKIPVKKIKASEVPPGKKRLLLANDQEISQCFQKIAGSENEVGWHNLQSILEYALTKAQPSADSSGFISQILSWVIGIFCTPSNGKAFSKDECRMMVDMLDDDRSGRLSLDEFMVLWRRLQYFELVFLNYSDSSNCLDATTLGLALREIDPEVMISDVSRFVRKYSDNSGKLSFGDFVMCSIELSSL